VQQLPATKENVKKLKKEQVPFSRIPTDQKVDPRFASNDYVAYDYADRAYQDLSVTKGKGFTKEKNKKKRGTSIPTSTSTSKPARKPQPSRKSKKQLDWGETLGAISPLAQSSIRMKISTLTGSTTTIRWASKMISGTS
jgi:hypothetical protein